MNRTALCIKMLQILNTHNRVSIATLAEMLETNPRNIKEFKKELEVAGYKIIDHRGRYGGYELDESAILPAPELLSDEKTALNEGLKYLLSKKDFLPVKNYQDAMCKIMSDIPNSQKNPVSIYSRFPLSITADELKLRYDLLSIAIAKKQRVKIVYTSKSNKDHIHIIHPYKLFLYADSWFVLANKEGLEKVLYYKINRIKDIEVLINQPSFRIPLYYKESDYLDEFGMKNNGDWIQVKFLVKNNANIMLNERIYGKDQKIEQISDNSSIVTCKMQDLEIVAFFLGWGSNCEVLEPASLKERLKEEIKKMQSIYQ